MHSKRTLFVLFVVMILAALAMVGCGAKETSVPTPTRTPKPTFTPTPEGQIVNAPLFQQDVNAAPTDEVAVLPTDTPTPRSPPDTL
ncbi:MAG TPA: hypothetical protein EYP25_07710, partial [Anaerolineae bacterium]|nr:hypothetical protein [Anaerolineae bacterium]